MGPLGLEPRTYGLKDRCDVHFTIDPGDVIFFSFSKAEKTPQKLPKPLRGFEPPTTCLQNRRSTIELQRQIPEYTSGNLD